ncbi:MAG: hypothetical protein EOR73_25475 [Mesorhizobium sp.]|nr:MAG: hypothetical protein EOR73_25475 [Mesorhizobium sp.]
MRWFFVLTAMLGLIGAARAQAITQADVSALEQLGVALADQGDAPLTQQGEALLRIATRETFANDIIVLLNAARDVKSIPDNVRGPDLLKQIFADPAAARVLPVGLPWSWKAIQPELCRVAGLPEERCITVYCLVPSLDPAQAKLCPPPLAAAQPKLELPQIPDDPKAFRQWLLDLGRALDPATNPIVQQLSKGELPLDAQIVAAKGELHAIWATMVERTRQLKAIKASDIAPVIRELLVANAQRVALAAQIVSASRAIKALPTNVSTYLDATATASLIKSGDALEARFSALTEGGDYSGLLSAEAEDEIRQGQSSIIALRQSVAKAIAKATEELLKSIVPDGITCPALASEDFFEIASAPDGEPPVTLALQTETKSPSGQFTAELALAITLPEPPVVQVKVDGVWQDAPKMEPIPGCDISQQMLIPLGITISHLEVVDGRPVLAAAQDVLVQATEAARFAEGLGEWIAAVAGAQVPATLTIRDARLRLSRDLRDIDVDMQLEVPLLGVPVSISAALIDDGKLVFNASADAFIDHAKIVEATNQWLLANAAARSVVVGPFGLKLDSAKLANDALRANGTWTALIGSLSLGNTVLGQAEVNLASKDGVPKLVLATDLTGLLRAGAGPLADMAEKAGQVFAEQFEFDPAVLSDIKRALLIERVELSDTGTVFVTLALSNEVFPSTQPIRVTEPLKPDQPDLGVPDVYLALAKAALSDLDWIKVAMSRLEDSAKEVAAAELKALAEKLQTAAAKAIGLKNAQFRQRSGSSKFDLWLEWEGGSATIENVALTKGGEPTLDLHEARLSSAGEQALGKFLQGKLIEQMNSLVGLSWKACGTPIVRLTGAGVLAIVQVDAELVGCIPLPAVAFDGNRFELDAKQTTDAIWPVLVQRIALLIPEDYRQYAVPRAGAGAVDEIIFDVTAEVTGLGQSLTGEVHVSLKQLKVTKVSVDTDVGDALFGAAIGAASSFLGDSFKITQIPNQFGIRASARVDLAFFSVGVEGMEITPKRVTIPEVRVRLPAAIIVGPLTIFPIEARAHVQKPVSATLIGDASFAGLEMVIKLRGSLGFEIPPDVITLGANVIMFDVLDLFESQGRIDTRAGTIDASSRTVGILAAIMPMEQVMHMDKRHATMKSSGKIIAISVEGDGEIVFGHNARLSVRGTASAGGLASLSLTFNTDLKLNDPRATVQGSVDFPLGDITFGADASRRSVLLKAQVIGISASLRLPSADDLHGGMIEALFKYLLKPSIDLESIKSLDVSISTQIGGGGGGNDGDGGDGGGDKGGGEDVGGDQNTAEDESTPIADPPEALLTGTVPSEWQSGFLPAPSDAGMFCKAEWRSPTDIIWIGDVKVSKEIAVLQSNPPKPSISLGRVAQPVQNWSQCKDPTYETPWADVEVYFKDGPQLVVQGAKAVESAAWVHNVLVKVDGPERGADKVTLKSLPSQAAINVLTTLFEQGLTSAADTALTPLVLTDSRTYWRITTVDGPVFLVDATTAQSGIRRFEPDDALRAIVAALGTDPTAEAPLRDSLLPVLFSGTTPRSLYHAEGRLLLATEAPGRSGGATIAFAVGPEAGALGCGAQIGSSNVPAGDPLLFKAITGHLLAAVGTSCTQSTEWTDLRGVTGGGSLQRVVAFRRGPETDWSLDFVDLASRNTAAPGCLRRGLSAGALETMLATWFDQDALTEADRAELLGSDRGLGAVLAAISAPDIDWLAVGFPLNPFSAAECEVL